MTKRFFPLLLVLFLWGCSARAPLPEVLPASTGHPSDAVSTELIPRFSQENLTVYSPAGDPIRDLLPVENGFLMIRDDLLTVYANSIPGANRTLDFPAEPAVHNSGKSISYFDPDAGQLILLNSALEETSRIDAPAGLSGTPLLSDDCRKLYYCTGATLRVLDLENGISRLIKEFSHSSQALSGIFLRDTVLEVQITEQESSHILYLCPDTGKLLCQRDDVPDISCTGNRYAAMIPDCHSTVLYSEGTDTPKVLLPRYPDSTPVILSGELVLTYFHTGDKHTVLDLYDLSSGKHIASTTLDGIISPDMGCCTGSSMIVRCEYTDGTQALLEWNVSMPASEDNVQHFDYPHDPHDSDAASLSACHQYASQIQQRYGIPVLIHQEASAAALSAELSTEPEYQTGILFQRLSRLDGWLDNLPAKFLETLQNQFPSLRICLVRKVEGVNSDGVSLRNGQDACIVLASGHGAEEALYRELFRLAETIVLNRSTAWDLWEEQNPSVFSYCASYGTDHRMTGQEWLQPGKESFLNTTSMHSAQEDRVQIMACAMIPGNGRKLQSPCLQEKLRRLCTGFREAFLLEEPSPWEQHLIEPLSS